MLITFGCINLSVPPSLCFLTSLNSRYTFLDLDKNGVNILGTSVRSIDQAEDRHKFSQLCDSLGIDQPAWSAFTSLDAASTFCDSVGYPVLVRPSYVLSGAAMRVVIAPSELKK